MAFPNSLPTSSFVVHCKASRINACGCRSPRSKLCLPICRHQHHVLLSEDNGSRSNASSDRLWIRNFKVPISVVSKEYIDYTGILPWPCHPWGGSGYDCVKSKFQSGRGNLRWNLLPAQSTRSLCLSLRVALLSGQSLLPYFMLCSFPHLTFSSPIFYLKSFHISRGSWLYHRNHN